MNLNFNFSKISSLGSKIAGSFKGINVNSIISGINPQSITSANLGSITSGIDSKLESITSDMESKISNGVANGGDIESLSKEMEAKMTSFESEFNPENLSLDGASGFASKLQNINFM